MAVKAPKSKFQIPNLGWRQKNAQLAYSGRKSGAWQENSVAGRFEDRKMGGQESQQAE
jgi:hypothetical protein